MDERHIHKKKVVDTKISAYVWTGPEYLSQRTLMVTRLCGRLYTDRTGPRQN